MQILSYGQRDGPARRWVVGLRKLSEELKGHMMSSALSVGGSINSKKAWISCSHGHLKGLKWGFGWWVRGGLLKRKIRDILICPPPTYIRYEVPEYLPWEAYTGFPWWRHSSQRTQPRERLLQLLYIATWHSGTWSLEQGLRNSPWRCAAKSQYQVWHILATENRSKQTCKCHILGHPWRSLAARGYHPGTGHQTRSCWANGRLIPLLRQKHGPMHFGSGAIGTSQTDFVQKYCVPFTVSDDRL